MDNHIQNSKNIVTGHIDAKGNVIVGDNIVINLKEAAQYVALEKEIEELDNSFQEISQQIQKNPNIDFFNKELIKINQRRNEKQKELEILKKEVINLAVQFSTIPINTERLRKANAYFRKGEFTAARAIFEVEKDEMNSELETAIQKGALGEKLLQQSKDERTKLANEYLLFARLTAIAFDLKDRFEKTMQYFEKSLQAERNLKNIFAFAHFLQEHKQNNKATPLYEEALANYRQLAEVNPQTYLPDVGMTLNNLAVLQSDKNEFAKAEKSYEEALAIYRQLAEVNPQTYLPNVAMTLNNLAVLQSDKNEFAKAEKSYEEALAIRRQLAEVNPQTYLPYVAGTLNNSANLQRYKNEFAKAEKSYEEALAIRRQLAEVNPQTYLPDVATTLNNLANLQSDKNEFAKAEKSYEEALTNYRQLAEVNPQTYLPNVGMTLNNLGILQKAKNEFAKAEKSYEEALAIRRQLAEVNPQTYLPDVGMTLNNLAVLQSDKNEFAKAEKSYEEALAIRRQLAEVNPQTYLPYVATTLNNLGLLQKAKNEFAKAEKSYEEALTNYRQLAEVNPQTYLPYVAGTQINMAILHLQSKSNKARSFELVDEAIMILLPFQQLGYIQNYLKVAFGVLNDLGVDIEAYLKEKGIDVK
jgi:tetratricopeptide (TPR) repeat protein